MTSPDELGSEDSQKFFASHARLTATSTTEAAKRTLATFRFAPAPPSWGEIAATVGVLYGLAIGLPAAAGIWAAWRIWQELHG